MRAALRMVRDWSQRDVADLWNKRWPGEPKTFKNFSYWENWPSKTGHAPSLEVLGRLAELYECSVGDLVLDYADFRHLDMAHGSRQELDQVREVITGMTINRGDHGIVPDLAALLERLDEMDVHEIRAIVRDLGSAGRR